MIDLILAELRDKDVETAPTIRIADRAILPGVTSDEGEGDDWPEVRKQILAADILVFGTPVWLGQASSIAKRVLERMDAFLDETDDQGRMPSYGKVAVAAIVAVVLVLIGAAREIGPAVWKHSRCARAGG